MSKLNTFAIVSLFASVAVAQNAGFNFLGTDPVAVPVGGTVDVLVASTSGLCGGMSLKLQARGEFEIVGLQVDGFPGAYWTGKINGQPQIDLYPKADFGSSYAIADLSTSLGNHVLPEGALLALVTIASIPGAPLGSTGTLTTTTDLGGESGLGSPYPGAHQQDNISLLVVPEPMTALLLLTALPLIRHRRP